MQGVVQQLADESGSAAVVWKLEQLVMETAHGGVIGAQAQIQNDAACAREPACLIALRWHRQRRQNAAKCAAQQLSENSRPGHRGRCGKQYIAQRFKPNLLVTQGKANVDVTGVLGLGHRGVAEIGGKLHKASINRRFRREIAEIVGKLSISAMVIWFGKSLFFMPLSCVFFLAGAIQRNPCGEKLPPVFPCRVFGISP